MLLTRQKPYRREPGLQRDTRSLEHRIYRDRVLCTAIPTMQVTSSRDPGRTAGPTAWTVVTRWSAKARKILATGRIVLKKIMELAECPRVDRPHRLALPLSPWVANTRCCGDLRQVAASSNAR